MNHAHALGTANRARWVLVLVALALSPAAAMAQLDELVAVARHVELSPDDALDRYKTFADKHAGHELGRLARLIAAGQMLGQLGKRDDPSPVARWLDARPAPSGSLKASLDQVERSLRAHVGLLRLQRALRDYHRTHVEYPEALTALVDEKRIDAAALTDPFGKPYAYQAKARTVAPDLPRQDFDLRCTSLGLGYRDLPALHAAMAQPMRDLTLRSTDPTQGEVFAAARRDDGTMGAARQWKIGQEQHDYVLVAVLDKLAVVSKKGLPRLLVVREGS